MTTLPKIPSKLLTLAIADFGAVLAAPERFRIDMSEWHTAPYPGSEYGADRKCVVCFAGSVMAGTLGMPDTVTAGAVDCAHNSTKIRALNYFRIGDVRGGLLMLQYDADELGVSHLIYADEEVITPWEVGKIPGLVKVQRFLNEHPSEFIDDMRHLVSRFEEVGL